MDIVLGPKDRKYFDLEFFEELWTVHVPKRENRRSRDQRRGWMLFWELFPPPGGGGSADEHSADEHGIRLQKELPWPGHVAFTTNTHIHPRAAVDKTFTNLVREKCGHLYCYVVKSDISGAIGAHESQKEVKTQMDINVH